MTTPTSTPVLPDSTSQTGPEYKGAIDASAKRAGQFTDQFAPYAQDTLDLTISLGAGVILNLDTRAKTAVAVQTTAAFVAPVTNPRIDLVYIDNVTGVYGVEVGFEAASPVVKACPEAKSPVCEVALAVSQAVIVNADMTDVRDLRHVGQVGNYNHLTDSEYASLPGKLGTDIAVASTIVIGDGDYFDLTGSGTIDDMTVAEGRRFTLVSAGATTFAFSSSIITEDGNDLEIEAGDVVMWQSIAIDTVLVTKPPSSGGGGWEFVEAGTAAASSTVSFTGFEAGFDYMLTWDKGLLGTSGASWRVRLGVTGPTYRATNYKGTSSYLSNQPATASLVPTTFIGFGHASQSNTAGQEGSAELTILNPNSSSKTFVNGIGGGYDSAGNTYSAIITQFHNVAEAIVAVEVSPSSGTIATGNFKLFKKANS